MKPWTKQGELAPLRYFADENAHETRNLERLRKAWPLIVGSGLGGMTHPVSMRHGLLLIGCHDASVLKSMRASAQDTWPELRQRINAMLNTHLQHIDVAPSDPPQPSPERTKRTKQEAENTDPLDAVLRYYRKVVIATR